MITISKDKARAFAIDSQMVELKKGKAGTLNSIERIGYVQIDTISVVERAHHHILWTRVPDYKPSFLSELEQKDRAIFDYWAHAAGYLPIQDYRFSLYRKAEIGEGNGHWYQKNPENMAYVLDKIKSEGALQSKDFEKEGFKSNIPWLHHPLNQALRQLFMEGKIMISGRQGFQKIFDIPERVLPANLNTDFPTQKEYITHIVKRDINAHGIIKTQSIGHLLKISIKEKQEIIDELVRSGELIAVKVEGLESAIFYAFTDKIESYSKPKTNKKFYLLSPFDNLVILRNRVQDLFDFSYTLECYVPEKKRKIGYFSLPLLYNNEFVGQADLKADRKTKILWVKNLVWEKSVKNLPEVQTAFFEKLEEFKTFNGCLEVQKSVI